MPCYYPITGYQPHGGGPLSFNHNAKDHNTIIIPCGRCTGCRLTTAREWATRCMHEKQMHKYNCYATLTYDEKNLPEDRSLQYRDFQLFMKRLRKSLSKESATLHTASSKVRFYMGGEYGEKYGRPHFHACLFGMDFADRTYHMKTPAGFKIYTSPTLNKIWKNGFASIGEITFQSAAYIARYIMKKQTGDGNKKHYHIIDLETGEIYIRTKEFNQMSRKPGIGKTWLDQYHKDAYPHGKVIVRGHQTNTPRYYDKEFKKIDQLAYEELQYQRQLETKLHTADQTPERLHVQEQVQLAKIRSLKRTFE